MWLSLSLRQLKSSNAQSGSVSANDSARVRIPSMDMRRARSLTLMPRVRTTVCLFLPIAKLPYDVLLPDVSARDNRFPYLDDSVQVWASVMGDLAKVVTGAFIGVCVEVILGVAGHPPVKDVAFLSNCLHYSTRMDERNPAWISQVRWN